MAHRQSSDYVISSRLQFVTTRSTARQIFNTQYANRYATVMQIDMLQFKLNICRVNINSKLYKHVKN